MLHCYSIFVFISFLVSRTVHILNCTLKLHLIQSKMSGEKEKEGPLIYVYDSALHYQFFCSQCYHLKLVGWSFVPNFFFGFPKIALMMGLIMNAFTGFMIPFLYGSFHFILNEELRLFPPRKYLQ